MSTESTVDRMNEFRDASKAARQLRENALELDDLVDEMTWVAAGGRGGFEPEEFERLATACRQISESLEDMDIPNAYDMRGEVDDARAN